MTTQAPWLRLAGAALYHAVYAEWGHASGCVRQLADQHGHDVIPQVMCAWIDTMLTRAYPTRRPGQPVDLRIVDVKDGRAGPQDPAQRWAGWVVSARAADDMDQLGDVLESIPEQQWTEVVWQVLVMCGTTIRVMQTARRGVTP